jgi:2-oxoglutarate ferredoxin oxidoreductase subunit gamma
MEREVILTGIGGQGVQLGAQVLARAATREGRHVMLLGTYGGTMRGGPTDATLVVGDAPLETPPIVAQTGAAIAMHHAFWEPLRRKLAPDAVVVLNASLFEAELDRDAQRVFEVPATALASEAGSALAASMVLVSAYAALTGLVGLDSLCAAMRECVPSYRRDHVETNERALRAGFEALPHAAAPAWTERAA